MIDRERLKEAVDSAKNVASWAGQIKVLTNLAEQYLEGKLIDNDRECFNCDTEKATGWICLCDKCYRSLISKVPKSVVAGKCLYCLGTGKTVSNWKGDIAQQVPCWSCNGTGTQATGGDDEGMTYPEIIQKYFPEDWANREKVCIYCSQKIKEGLARMKGGE